MGFTIGPLIGARLIRMAGEGGGGGGGSVRRVFLVAVVGSGINLFLVTFVFPESLTKEKQRNARVAEVEELAPGEGSGNNGQAGEGGEGGKPLGGLKGLMNALVMPMSVFIPVRIEGPDGKRRRDWSLTLIGAALFGFQLSYVSQFHCLPSFLAFHKAFANDLDDVERGTGEVPIRRTRILLVGGAARVLHLLPRRDEGFVSPLGFAT